MKTADAIPLGTIALSFPREVAETYCALAGFDVAATVPASLALRVFTEPALITAMQAAFGQLTPVHVGQSAEIFKDLAVEAEYRAELSAMPGPRNRVKVTARIKDAQGVTCLVLTGEFAIIAGAQAGGDQNV